jgi:uncharacterized protein (DUF305 family)
MTDLSLHTAPALDDEDDLAPAPVDRLRMILAAVIVVALLAAVGAVGYLIGHNGNSSSAALPGDTSIDAGFARDMITHHEQAVQMAIIMENASADPQITTLAFDIETSQTFQEGQMNGWLDSWNLTRQTKQPMMAWMSGDDGMSGMDMSTPSTSTSASTASDPTGENTSLMPGMATPAQMTQLENATGTAQDVLFLQLMLRHHQGGIEMAQYAAAHAAEPYVAALAKNMASIQTREVVLMQQMLTTRGAQPLPS